MKPKTFYRDLFDFRRDFDEIFNLLTIGWPTRALHEAYVPPVEAWTDPEAKKFYARVALPGVDPKDAKVEARQYADGWRLLEECGSPQGGRVPA